MEKTLTIVLEGHKYKYEVEATIKIFYPATRFNIIYGSVPDKYIVGNYVYTLIKPNTKEKSTVIYSRVRIGTEYKEDTLILDYLNESYKDEFEYQLCRLIYGLLKSLTRKESAWGLLTGIRPVKKYIDLIDNGLSKNDAVRYMEERYLVSAEKSKLAYDTAMIQIPLLKAINPKQISLYVSIPFCTTRCSYCSFVSHSIESAHKLIPGYVTYLCEEIKSIADLLYKYNLVVDTIYFGGGTPTSINDSQLIMIMEKIKNLIDLSTVREYCVEAGRPDTITKSKLEIIKRYGASRISVNPQTFNDSVLHTIGRRHTAKQTIDAYMLAREIGFNNINMDLIAGLPTDTLNGFKKTLDTAINLNPDAITVHTLTLKRSATLFEDKDGRNNVNNPVSDMVNYSIEMLTTHGYHPYYMYRQKNTAENLENVGYSRIGKESLYNIYIMDESQTILGVGAGASTKLVGNDGRISRVHNYKFPYEYINRFDQLMKKRSAIDEFFMTYDR